MNEDFLLDKFDIVKDCIYKNEKYSVRDNGAVLRHAQEGKNARKIDNAWTFGKLNIRTGYMEISGERVHRIVATAFLGEAPTKEHVVDHIDTNKRNNRPENLRWLTKLENILLNPITMRKLEIVCGSVEAFLADPSKFRDKFQEPNFAWMTAVSKEEAKNSYERLLNWAKSEKMPTGGTLGEWVFRRESYYASRKYEYEEDDIEITQERFFTHERPIDTIEEIKNEVAATTNEVIYKTSSEIVGAVQQILKVNQQIMLPSVKIDSGYSCGLLIENTFLEKFTDVQFVFEGKSRIPKYIYLVKDKQRLALYIKTKNAKQAEPVELVENELGITELDLVWAKNGLTENAILKLLITEHSKISWLQYSKKNKDIIDKATQALQNICEPLRHTGRGVLHSYVVCPLVPEPYNGYNGADVLTECSYCKYNFEGSCFGKARVETYEELQNIVEVKKQDNQIVSIAYNKDNKLETTQFDFYDPDANPLGKSLLTLWGEKKGNILTAVNKRSDWHVLVEEDPNKNLKNKGEVYARLSMDLEALPQSNFRTIWGYADKEWEEVGRMQ